MNEFTRRLPEGCQRSKTLHLGANHPVSHKALYRYLDVVEAQLASPRNPTLCFVWTPSLAGAQTANWCIFTFPIQTPREAARLDALLRGEL